MSRVKKIFFPIICLAVALFIFAFLWKVPEWHIDSSKGSFTPKERIELENNARRTWAQILGGVFFLITAYFTWRRVIAAERNVIIAQEGQITERFTRAIDQLGAIDTERGKNLGIRLGGIYALERIARDSKKDHWTIMEVLTAYVRENAPLRGQSSRVKKKGEREKNDRQPPESSLRPSTDIQAILTVLGRRKVTYEKREDWTLNLSETDLRAANLLGANFFGVDFSGANLERADLSEAKLELADFEGANLEKTNLSEANLRHAHLDEANLKKALLLGTNLRGVSLGGTHLDEAVLGGANLKGASLVGTNLEGAFLLEANLEEAHSLKASFKRANLEKAKLKGAFLSEIDFRMARNLTIEQLSEAKTLFRAKLDPPLLKKIKEKYPHLLEKPKSLE